LRFDAEKRRDVPVFGRKVGFFGAALTEDEAAALVDRGKLTFQARNWIPGVFSPLVGERMASADSVVAQVLRGGAAMWQPGAS